MISKSIGVNISSSDEQLINIPLDPQKPKPASGVGEWATGSANIQKGCKRNCRYCYAQSIAIRFRRATPASWATPIVDQTKVAKRYKKMSGRIMFPTSHDICQENIDACITTLNNLMASGNDILIVSKPDPACVHRMCHEFADRKAQILFRFTIGSSDDVMLSFWEPGAPTYSQRMEALMIAFNAGFATSISCEPMLDTHIDKVVGAVLPYVTDAVWLGRVNNLRQIIALNCPGNVEVKAAADRLLAEQTDDWLRELYVRFKDNPKVKFKDSIKKTNGLDRPTESGLDV